MSEHTPEMPTDGDGSQDSVHSARRLGDTEIAAVVFAVAGVVLVLGAAPGALWLDTSEFGAVGWRLSVSHPPGHPLHALVTKAIHLFAPIGDLAFRSNLLSAGCVAAALAAFYGLVREMAPGNHPVASMAFALSPLLFSPIYDQGVRSEVYGLQLLLSVILAWGSWRVATDTDRRWLPLLALTFGLAGSNHSFIGAYWIPFALFAMWRGGAGRREIAAATVAGACGLSVYGYLPLRAHSGGEVGWGAPDTLARFVETITGRAWIHNLLPAQEAPGSIESMGLLAGYVVQHFGLILGAVALLLVCVATPVWVRGRRGLALVVFIAAALPFALRLGNEVDLSNPDLGGYLASGFLAMILLAALASTELPPVWRTSGSAFFVVAIAAQVITLDVQNSVQSDRSNEQYVRELFSEMPVGGVLLVSDYSTMFTAWSLRAFEGVRPDIGVVYRGQVEQEWHRRRASVNRPQMKDSLTAYPQAFFTAENRWENGVKLDSLGKGRTQLMPVGLTLSFGAIEPQWEVFQSAFNAFDGAGFAGRRFRALLHVHFIEQLRHIHASPSLITWHLKALKELAPNDPMAKRLLRQR